jgi:hypothetical protein
MLRNCSMAVLLLLWWCVVTKQSPCTNDRAGGLLIMTGFIVGRWASRLRRFSTIPAWQARQHQRV